MSTRADTSKRRARTAPVLSALAALALGALATLLSTFVGERSAGATYPEIMGCETGCRVVATGWPFVFVRDYTGMSVVNSASILEVLLAADRFDPLPFCANLIAWAALCWLILTALRRRRQSR